MSQSKKKRVVEEMDCGDGGEDTVVASGSGKGKVGEEESSDQFMNEEVQIEFEARNPEDHDFHGIKKLLQQLFLKANINLSELSDTIISQNYIGSVLKQAEIPEDDDDDDDDDVDEVFGIVTALNMNERKDLECIQQLQKVLLDKCSQCAPDKKSKFESLLSNDAGHTGFLLNERFINMPPQIALPTFDSLWKECDRAKKKMKYDFQHYVLISKLYKMVLPGGKGKQQTETIFVNAEEEFFAEEAVLRFDFSVVNEMDTAAMIGGDEEYEPLRAVLVIPADRIPSIMVKLKDALS